MRIEIHICHFEAASISVYVGWTSFFEGKEGYHKDLKIRNKKKPSVCFGWQKGLQAVSCQSCEVHVAPRISNCGYVRTMVPLNHEMAQDLVKLLLELGENCKIIFFRCTADCHLSLASSATYHWINCTFEFFSYFVLTTTKMLICSQIETKWDVPISPRRMNNIIFFFVGLFMIFIVHDRRSAWREKGVLGHVQHGVLWIPTTFFWLQDKPQLNANLYWTLATVHL